MPIDTYKQKFALSGNYQTPLDIFKETGMFIQSASFAHSMQMGLSINALQAGGFSWVLARQQTLLLRLPQPGTEIEIETWPSEMTRLKCFRDFTIRDNDGQILGHSLTDWVVLNLQTRHAERLPDFIAAKHPAKTRHAMPRFPLKPGPLEPQLAVAKRTAQAEDIDLNNHVTNASYVEFILDTVPEEIKTSCRPVFFDIHYRAEALEGEHLEIRRQEADPQDIAAVTPELDALLASHNCKAFWHSMVKRKSKLLFFAQEKEFVRAFSLWA